jgi:hypothetical protein
MMPNSVVEADSRDSVILRRLSMAAADQLLSEALGSVKLTSRRLTVPTVTELAIDSDELLSRCARAVTFIKVSRANMPPMRRLIRPTTREGRVATKARACYLAHRHTSEKMGPWLRLVPRPIDRRWSCRRPSRIVAGCARARIAKGQEGRVANHYDHLRQELADACIDAMFTFQGQVHNLDINRKLCHG